MSYPISERDREKAAKIWNSLHDSYGESLTRKFGPAAPDMWVELFRSLKDYEIQRGVRRLMASGRREVPVLPEFRRLCVEVGDDGGALPDPKALEANYHGDKWTTYANRFLLRLISECGSRRVYFDAAATAELVKVKNMFAADLRDLATNGPIPMTTVKELWALYVNDIVSTHGKTMGHDRLTRSPAAPGQRNRAGPSPADP